MQVVRTGFQDGLQGRRRAERYGPYSLLLGLALIVPLWLFYGFHLRKRYMLYRVRRRMRRNTDDEQRAA